MNIVILGNGPEEQAWADAIDASTEHRLIAAWPGFPDRPELPGRSDFDAALVVDDIDAVIVGGPIEERAESLRRTAVAGFACVGLHPPGSDADPYYQVALSRFETGAIVVPDLPGRLHPGVARFRAEAAQHDEPAELRIERTIENRSLFDAFTRDVDLVRALIGEPTQIWAVGDPPGAEPTAGLIAQLRASDGRRAELRLRVGSDRPTTIEAIGRDERLRLEAAGDWAGPTALHRIRAQADETLEEWPAWDPKTAILRTLGAARSDDALHPNLTDATKAMELATAARSSLERGRTVELHEMEVSEAGNFKAVMTSVGCLLLIIVLVLMPLALAGPALGFQGTIYIAYLIPPLLIVFLVLQLLKLGIRTPSKSGHGPASQPPERAEAAGSKTAPPSGPQ